MSRPQRTKKYVDANVQGALARRLVLHWLTFMAVTSTVSLMLQALSNPFQPLVEHLANMWWTQGPFLLVMAFLLPVFVVDTIKLSHRFAGPIFSLRRAMREVAEGKKPRTLKFRGGDFWHDLAEEYNAMLAKLSPAVEDGKPTADEEQPVGSRN